MAQINNVASIFPVYSQSVLDRPPPGFPLMSFYLSASDTTFSLWAMISNSFPTGVYIKVTTTCIPVADSF